MMMTINQKVEKILVKSVISTKRALCEELGITRPTLDSKLSGKTKWKKLEEKWIDYIYQKINN